MTLTKDMIDLLSMIRTRAKEEGLGTLRLADPALLNTLHQLEQTTTSDLTRHLIQSFFRMQAGPGALSAPETFRTENRYRGAVVHKDDAPQPVDAQKKSVRMYRGRPVPA